MSDIIMPKVEVAWYGDVIGIAEITPDGKLLWEGGDHAFKGLFDGEEKDVPPMLLKNLAPEGWLNAALKDPDPLDYLQTGLRFLSNITIATSTKNLYTALDLDRVLVPLETCTENGVFRGVYTGPKITETRDELSRNIAVYWHNKTMPKFSGIQMKLPVTVFPAADEDGPMLAPAVSSSFSHILKFSGSGYDLEPTSALEWMGLEMAERAGLSAAKHALVSLGENNPPALLVERFDIPQADEEGDKRYLIADFCTLTGIPAKDKYTSSAEKSAKAMMEVSTDRKADAAEFLKRHAFAWFSCDSDMHMKNISVLKTVDMETGERSVKFSPAYDTLPITALVPYENKGDLSMTVAGKTKKLNGPAFIQLGKILGLDRETTLDIISDVGENVAKAAVDIARNPPSLVAENANCLRAYQLAATQIVKRVKDFGLDVPEWTPVEVEAAEKKRAQRFWKENNPSYGYNSI